MTVNLLNLPPNTPHGFHIHEFGDTFSQGCNCFISKSDQFLAFPNAIDISIQQANDEIRNIY